MPALITRAAQQNPAAGHIAGDAEKLLPLILQHPTALYVGAPDAQGPPMPSLVIMTEAGSQTAALESGYQKLLKEAGPTPAPVRVESAGGSVFFEVGMLSPQKRKTLGLPAGQSTDPPAPNLAADPTFKADLAQTLNDPILTIHINTEALFALAALVPHPPHEPNAMGIIQALGLTGIKSATVAAGFDFGDWSVAAFIKAPAPRQGLLKALIAKPLDNHAFEHVPESAVLAKSYRFDLAAMFNAIDSALAHGDPTAHTQYVQAMNMLNHAAGENITQQLLPAFGDEWTTYIDKSIGGTGLTGMVLINRPQNTFLASAAMIRLVTGLNRFVAEQTHNPKLDFKTRTAIVNAMTVHYVPTPIVSPAWVIRGNTLYIGLFPQTALAAAAYNGLPVTQNIGFRRLRSELRGEDANLFSYADLKQALPAAYPQLLMLQGYTNFGNLLGVKVPPLVIPTLHQLELQTGPMAMSAILDDIGLHYRYRSPFPGSVLIAAMQGGAMQSQQSLLALGMLLPALSSARAAANQMAQMPPAGATPPPAQPTTTAGNNTPAAGSSNPPAADNSGGGDSGGGNNTGGGGTYHHKNGGKTPVPPGW